MLSRRNMKNPALQALWQEHEAAKFPIECYGVEVDGADLVLCDSYAAGSISTFLEVGVLDTKRKNVLIGCIEVLHGYIVNAHGEPKQYFERLLRMSEGVLEETSQDDR